MTSENDPMVHPKHVRQAKVCMRGVREWAAANGLDYQEFVDQGIRASVLEATGDHFAIEVAKVARAEAEK